jgi:hypothetical protein
MLKLRMRPAAVAVLAGVLLGAGLSAAQGRIASNGTRSAASQTTEKLSANVPSCSQFHIPLYGVVQMADRSSTIPSSAGLLVATIHMVNPSATPSLLTNATESDGVTRATVDGLKALPGVQKAGLAFAQSSDPRLRSCDYMLSDRPADQPLVSAATSAIQAGGLATRQQVDSIGAIYLVSDDPLDASKVIVTIDAPTTATTLPGGGQSSSIVHLTALVDRSTHSVSQIGVVPTD